MNDLREQLNNIVDRMEQNPTLSAELRSVKRDNMKLIAENEELIRTNRNLTARVEDLNDKLLKANQQDVIKEEKLLSLTKLYDSIHTEYDKVCKLYKIQEAELKKLKDLIKGVIGALIKESNSLQNYAETIKSNAF